MRIVCISDTHNHEISVPDGDLLIHAGDLTMGGTLPEVVAAIDWLDSLPHKWKVFIAGNHDFLFERDPVVARSIYNSKDLIYLEDEFTNIQGFKIYGSPYQPWFFDWAFNLERYDGSLQRKWSMIPDNTNILITHGPPKGILDRVKRGENVGCYDLMSRIENLRHLKLFVCGHIHEGYGQVEYHNGVKFVNASNCNLGYDPVNLPIVVNL